MNRPATLLLAALAAAATACASGPADTAATPPAPADATTSVPTTTPAPGGAGSADASSALFTDEQAGRGRATFRAVCADCHYSSEFRDAQFKFKWGKRTVAELYRNIVENMPEDAPGSLPPQQYVDVVTYILQLNGFAPGASELSGDGVATSTVTLDTPSGRGGPLP